LNDCQHGPRDLRHGETAEGFSWAGEFCIKGICKPHWLSQSEQNAVMTALIRWEKAELYWGPRMDALAVKRALAARRAA
jgi:hypothetical protein